jgi:DNA repair photolyase
MYSLNPRHIYAMDWAVRDPRNVRRMERLVRGIGRDPGEVKVIAAEDLPGVTRANRWVGEVRQGAYREVGDPDIIFNAFKWITPEERGRVAKSDLYKRCVEAHTTYGDCKQWFTGGRVQAMFGAATFYHYERRPEWKRDLVCWSLHDLHSAWGCAHRCAYCQRGSVYVINLNLEEFLQRVDQLLAENPWQKTFRYDVEQDVLAIEPEYGACEMLVRDFARRDNRFLILFSKSANVDHLLALEHKGHTIMLWTLTTPTVSRLFEPKTGAMEERIEAARKCQQAGYTVRFKCKPIIPIRNWREETTRMFEYLYSRVRPDNISMETVFFDSVNEMDQTLGLENLDPAFVEAAREAEAKAGDKWPQDLHGPRPFPFEVKEAIYRHYITESRRLSPETPISLCAETMRMWEALSDLLPWKPWNYICNCGPQCPPRLRGLTTVEGPDAARVQKADRDGCAAVAGTQKV